MCDETSTCDVMVQYRELHYGEKSLDYTGAMAVSFAALAQVTALPAWDGLRFASAGTDSTGAVCLHVTGDEALGRQIADLLLHGAACRQDRTDGVAAYTVYRGIYAGRCLDLTSSWMLAAEEPVQDSGRALTGGESR